MPRYRSRVRDSFPAPDLPHGTRATPGRPYRQSADGRGAIAKRLCTGLQIRVGGFDSRSRLQKNQAVVARFPRPGVFPVQHRALHCGEKTLRFVEGCAIGTGTPVGRARVVGAKRRSVHHQRPVELNARCCTIGNGEASPLNTGSGKQVGTTVLLAINFESILEIRFWKACVGDRHYAPYTAALGLRGVCGSKRGRQEVAE